VSDLQPNPHHWRKSAPWASDRNRCSNRIRCRELNPPLQKVKGREACVAFKWPDVCALRGARLCTAAFFLLLEPPVSHLSLLVHCHVARENVCEQFPFPFLFIYAGLCMHFPWFTAYEKNREIGVSHSLCSFGLSANQPAVFFSLTKSAPTTNHQLAGSTFFS